MARDAWHDEEPSEMDARQKPVSTRTDCGYQSRIGVDAVRSIFVRDLGWVFRDQPVDDYGIDAYVEIADEQITGRLLAMQIKSGPSWFRGRRTRGGWRFYPKTRHVAYWLDHSLPVIIVLYDPLSDRAYWCAVSREALTTTRTGNCRLVVPDVNVLGPEAAPALASLADVHAGVSPRSQRHAARTNLHDDAIQWQHARDVPVEALGVHRVAQLDGFPRVPTYVTRDRDDELVTAVTQAAEHGGFIVVEGESSAGKTRAATHALHTVLGEWRLSVPDTPEQVPVAASAARNSPNRCVVWLDDLDYFIGPDGLTSQVLDQLMSAHAVLLATLRTGRLRAVGATIGDTDSMVKVGHVAPSHYDAQADRLLKRANFIHYDRMWTDEEIARARMVDDPRLDDAATVADQYGIGEYLAAGPQILSAYRAAWSPGAHPRGAALVAAAIDLRRAGIAGPMPLDLIVDTHEHLLAHRNGHRLRPESLEEAISWATAVRCGATSPLEPGPHLGTYEPFDYLVDAAESSNASILQPVWNAALEHTEQAPVHHYHVGDAASAMGEWRIAYRAWRRYAEEGHGPPAFRLGCLLASAKLDEEAEHWYHVAIEGGDWRGAVNLAARCRRRDDLDGAEHWYRQAADHDWLAAMNLAELHRDRDDWRGAVRWYLRGYELGDTLDALHIIASTYDEHGYPDLAQAYFDMAIEVGSLEALEPYAWFAYRHGDWTRALALCDVADESSFDRSDFQLIRAEISRNQGDYATAENIFREALEAGEISAAGRLNMMLSELGRDDEAAHFKAIIESALEGASARA